MRNSLVGKTFWSLYRTRTARVMATFQDVEDRYRTMVAFWQNPEGLKHEEPEYYVLPLHEFEKGFPTEKED